MKCFIKNKKQKGITLNKRRRNIKLFFCGIVLSLLLLLAYEKTETNERVQMEKVDKLTVYTSHKREVYEPIIHEFEERTGIWVEVKTGGTNELLEMIKNENGKGSGDLMFGGGVDSLEAYSDFFEAYISKQSGQIDPTYGSKDNKYIVFSKIPMVMIYNKKLVYQKDIPHKWEDLLDAKWKGKIAFANPEQSGSCYTALVILIQAMSPRLSKDEVIEALTDNLDGKVSASSGSVIKDVQNGNKYIGVVLEETIKKQLYNNPDIEMIYPKEGISMLPDGCAIIKNAPHKESAELFMEFVVCEDVQRLLVNQLCRRSVRKDIETNSSQKEIIYDMAYAQENREQILEKWYEQME